MTLKKQHIISGKTTIMLLKKINILLVDDDPKIRALIKYTLNQEGFKNIQQASNGNEALAALRDWNFDLVLLDWDMPGMTGGEVLEKIKSDPVLEDLKILMTSAHAERDYVVTSLQLGATDYLIKPFSPDSLYQKIEKLFSKAPSS